MLLVKSQNMCVYVYMYLVYTINLITFPDDLCF